MTDYPIALTLFSGVFFAFVIFMLLYKVFKLKGYAPALLTLAVMWTIYIPLAAMNWPGIDIFTLHFVFYSMTAYGLGIITMVSKNRPAEDDSDHPYKQWAHIGPAIIIIFFLLLSVVDSQVIGMAYKYKTGVVSQNFHEKENMYNDYQKQLAMQKQRGWALKGGFKQTPQLNQTAPLAVTLLDKQGQVIRDAELTLHLLSTKDPDADIKVKLSADNSGQHSYDVTLTEPGFWDIVIEARKGDIVHRNEGRFKVVVKGDPCADLGQDKTAHEELVDKTLVPVCDKRFN